MKLYCLYTERCDRHLGVFSTLEKAEEAKKEYCTVRAPWKHEDDVDIEEVVLDELIYKGE